MYDVIIKNGTVIDGTGSRAVRADIAVDGEKIKKIANLKNEEAKLTIDAENLYVTPGFIDLTTHSDSHWTLFSHPNQESFLMQGITTILGGHGGSSLAPIINKESIGSKEKWLEPSDININWQTLEQFFSELSKHNLKINFGTLTGHETLRRNILKNQVRRAKNEEIKEMANLLAQSLNEGSFGLSTNLGSLHGQAASDSEIDALLQTVTQNNGTSMHHMEDEGKNLLPALSRIITFLRTTRVKGHIAHLKAIGRMAWEYFDNALSMIENARKEGVQITCDFYPYTRTGSNMSSLLPSWALLGNEEKVMSLFKNEVSRKNLKNHFKELTLHYNKITVASAQHSANSVGKTLKEISEMSGLTPEDVILQLLEINNLRVSIFNEVLLEKNIENLSAKPYSMIASDGVGYDLSKIKDSGSDLAHPRSFGAFPKAINWFVKQKKSLSWEDMIYKMSGLPAATLGLEKRGALKEDHYADIIIFNPQEIKDTATYENPFSYSKGIKFVFVNGVLTIAEDKLKNDKSGGKIIKKE